MEPKKKGISIKVKLIAVIVPIVLIIIFSFFALSTNIVLKMSQTELQAQTQVYTEQVNSWINRMLGEVKVYQDTINNGNFKDDEEILEFMKTSMERNEAYPNGLYMGDDAGNYLDASDWVPGDDWILTERDWYVDGKGNEEIAFGEPYYDSQSGDMCVSGAVHMDYPGATRVMAFDVYLDYASQIVSKIAEQSNIEAFLVTKESQTIIAHQNPDMIAVELSAEENDALYKNIAAAVQAGSEGIMSLKGNSGNYQVCLNPVENTNWYFVTYMTEDAMLLELHQMEIIMFTIAVVATIILIFGVLGLMSKVVKPIGKMTNVIDNISIGDFSQEVETKGNDEIARMSSRMQSFILQMRGTISEIATTAQWLNKQSAENEEVSESLKNSSVAQAESVANLGQTALNLSEATQNVVIQMDKLTQVIKEARQEGASANVLMKDSVIISENGKHDMTHINTGMETIKETIDILSEQINQVKSMTVQIGGMVKSIMDIASETNMLSLNASIEAARAGEAGKGFSIVATQIGKLAANSRTAADDIARLTAEIEQTVDAAVEHMEASTQEVHQNTEMVLTTCTNFDNLYEKVNETGQRVTQMIELIETVDDVAEQMEQITRNESEAAEHISELVEELNLHTKTVTDNSNTVAEGAEKFKEESTELSERMEWFKL